jgi:hypothetical protein
MKIIHYAGDELMTGDDIADAVVQYAETLAVHETSASVEIPIVMENGDIVVASFLLGPASQLVAVPADSDLPDPVDRKLLERILHERAVLDDRSAHPGESRDEDRFDYEL